MCYFCHCFGWTLDLIQRAITFALACCLGLAVCFGLAMAVVAGIAYGYNYCMAEFITFTRSDVTVFMRRGQFPEKPHDTLLRNSRRSDDSIDYFSQNISTDYDEMTDNNKTNNKPLSDFWMKNQETKNYAEKLTKYSLIHKTQESRPVQPATFGYYVLTSPSPRIISVIPHLMQPTTLLQSGSSQILMREFQPDDISQVQTYNTIRSVEIADATLPRSRNTMPQIPMRHWGTSEGLVIADYPLDEQDDDSIIYKPV
ncbi:hypothetical protein K1T71_007692 [Dendrolimus kikuchii]|uniref:Uncharacterized protein n=1 Tax=Dendrolimus kikuchii TaxID=765133 RepID=A0ACC1CXY5_9NEOP|nr:hypothetical protein K1T71_007692 [Dendrolimus kikuchii]